MVATPSPKPPAELPDTVLEVEESQSDERTVPAIMHVSSLSKLEREKVARICNPKRNSGKLEVPEDIHKMWNTEKGKQKHLEMWCKSGGLKAGCVFLANVRTGLHSILSTADRQVVFKQTAEILSVTTKTKLVRVTGGFYSEEDMKKELEYTQCPRFQFTQCHCQYVLPFFLGARRLTEG